MISPLTTATIPARNFTAGRRDRVRLVVLHSTESDCTPGRARQVAEWFGGATAPQASAHYVVDDNDIVSCVDEGSVAWAAPGANSDGISIEMCGFARWERAEWEAHTGLLANVRNLIDDICARQGFPVQIVDAHGLLAGDAGVTLHRWVSDAWHKSDHWDPGYGFPLERVAQLDHPATVPMEDDMTPAQLAQALGGDAVGVTIGLDGVIRVPLVRDDLETFDAYPLGQAITFLHAELKRARLKQQP